METNLAEIDRLTTAKLDQIFEHPNVPPVFKSLAGFQIFDSDSHAREILGRRGRVTRFRGDRESVIRDLKQCSVAPLAVIPRKLWYQICHESGLFRFTPENGNIRASNRDAKFFWTAAGLLSLILWSLPILATVAVMTQMSYWHRWQNANRCMALLLAAELITYFVMATGFRGKPFAWGRKWLAKGLTTVIFDWGSHAWVMERLFPDRTEVPARSDYVGTKLILPRLPAEIAPILERVHKANYPMHVAVVPEAFRLSHTPSELFTHVYTRNANKQVEAVQRFWEDVLADPIIYIEQGEMVAIIAQFGDFPIEREAVEKAMAQEDCLL